MTIYPPSGGHCGNAAGTKSCCATKLAPPSDTGARRSRPLCKFVVSNSTAIDWLHHSRPTDPTLSQALSRATHLRHTLLGAGGAWHTHTHGRSQSVLAPVLYRVEALITGSAAAAWDPRVF